MESLFHASDADTHQDDAMFDFDRILLGLAMDKLLTLCVRTRFVSPLDSWFVGITHKVVYAFS